MLDRWYVLQNSRPSLFLTLGFWFLSVHVFLSFFPVGLLDPPKMSISLATPNKKQTRKYPPRERRQILKKRVRFSTDLDPTNDGQQRYASIYARGGPEDPRHSLVDRVSTTQAGSGAHLGALPSRKYSPLLASLCGVVGHPVRRRWQRDDRRVRYGGLYKFTATPY